MELFSNKKFDEAIKAMGADQMNALLRELEGTAYWPAILKYQRERKIYGIAMLASLDPHTQSTDMARGQGSIAGLSDLEGYVDQLANPRQVEEE